MKRITFNKGTDKSAFRRLELKAPLTFASADNGTAIRGYAAVWDALTGDRGGFYEVFAKGSMRLPHYPVVLLYNHNEDYLLASEQNDTLKFSEDAQGIALTATLDKTFIEDYIVAKMKKGTIKGMSIGMYAMKSHKATYTVTEADGKGNSELANLVGKSVDVLIHDEWLLDELTITGRPAFPQTSIETFSRDNEGKSKEKDESIDSYIWEAHLRGFPLD
jgi:HK97 family phage prohead protease